MMKIRTSIMCVALIILINCTGNSPSPVKSLPGPAADGSRLPRLVSDSTNNLLMSWVEPDPNNINTSVLKYARLHGDSWMTPVTIAKGEDWFVNWADFPTITAVSGQPRAVHWLQKVPGNAYSYHVKVSVTDEQNQWSDSFSPHYDNTATEHGFVSMIPWDDQSTLAIWLDGRQSANRGDGDYFDLDYAMTLRSAVISRSGSVTESKLIDQAVCDCCQTALIKTPEGALAAFRNRTDEEIRDIYISRYTAGNWSKPAAIHSDGWKIGACPVNGPALAITDSVAVVAWFTGVGNEQRVKAAISTDAGRTFSTPITIDDGNAIGRVDASVDKAGNVFVSWMKRTTKDGVANLKVQALSPDGTRLGSRIITKMNAARKSGFPQMELQNNRLIFAWTNIEGDHSKIDVASLSADFADE